MKKFYGSVVVSMLIFGLLVTVSVVRPEIGLADATPEVIAEGKKIAFDRRKGNCLACHIMDDGQFPGNHGPPLIFMERRFPDKQKLRDRIFDATASNPNSMMPPFGRHGILTEEEIDKITEYVYTL